MTSTANLINYIKKLDGNIKELTNIISTAPEGILKSKKTDKGNYEYYQKIFLPDGSIKEIYLGKDALPKAVHLAKKALAKKLLPVLISERDAVEKLLKLRKQAAPDLKYLADHPGIESLLAKNSLIGDPDGRKWKNAPYNRNQKYPEGLKYSTVVPGLMVRSKAEADLAGAFERNSVPYHYDEIVNIGGIDFAIDFICLNVRTRKIWYWDHRGMMDNTEYIQKTLNCDAAFLNHGIIPWVNLIITTETRDQPLDLQWVEMLIRFYLL